MPVTILDIAKASKKSYPTVSRALNNHPKISAKTTAEIKRIAEELGYRPSFAGKMLKSGKTDILSVIVPDLADPFYSEYISQFKINAAQKGLDVVVYDYELDPEQEKRCLERILSGYCDGSVAFISSFAHTRKIVQKLWNAQIPLVAVGTPHEFDKGLKYDVVSSDWGTALTDLLKTLKNRNHRNFAFAASRIMDQSVILLMEMLEQACKDTGFSFSRDNFFRPAKNSANQAEDGLLMGRLIFSQRTDIDIIVVWNSFQAYGLIRAAQEAGKKIPEDVTIIVRDNTWVSKYSTVPLFSIDQRLDIMAQKSFDLIEQRLSSRKWLKTNNIRIKSETVCPHIFN